MNIVERAKSYAIEMHEITNCTYGDDSYEVHLAKVVEVAEGFIYLIPEEDINIVLAACWGHDVMEGTRENYNDVKKILGEDIADIIYDVTNEKGKNRKERALKTYPRIALNFRAVFVKLSDRIANMFSSKNTKHGMYKKYCEEYPVFREFLYNSAHGFDEIWAVLDDLCKE